jgi:hypothetical protein
VTKSKFSSPRLKLTIEESAWDTAKGSDSGGCLIADAIRAVYPVELRKDDIDVNVATIEIRDRAAGVKYTYLTPGEAQHLLLAFDQEWPQPFHQFTVGRAVKITPIRKGGAPQLEGRKAARIARVAELDAKEAAGEPLTPIEKNVRSRMRNTIANPPPDRATTEGRAEVEEVNGTPVVYGGRALLKLPGEDTRANFTGPRTNFNLLGGRRRIYGAKIADPGTAFNAAVERRAQEIVRAKAEA